MKKKERYFISFLFFLISIVTTIDIIDDLKDGVDMGHVFIEITIAAAAAIGFLYLVYAHMVSLNSLKKANAQLFEAQGDLEKWKNRSKSLIEGLSESIDQQFEDWDFSDSEQEIARLMIKGLSNKEISEIRGTSEKTIKVQITSILKKSNLKSRNELLAFFLEDLF